MNEAKAMMASSGMKILSIDNLDEAARSDSIPLILSSDLRPNILNPKPLTPPPRLAAKMSSIVGLAKEANLQVSFQV